MGLLHRDMMKSEPLMVAFMCLLYAGGAVAGFYTGDKVAGPDASFPEELGLGLFFTFLFGVSIRVFLVEGLRTAQSKLT